MLLARRKIRTSLEAWCTEALAPLGQAPAAHHRVLIQKLEAVAWGEIDRLMIFMPPGHAKSTYASKLFPAWFLARQRGMRIIGASATMKLAVSFSYEVQRFIRDNSAALGMGLLRENVEDWTTTTDGSYITAGARSQITGRRSDLAILDDVVSGRLDAESENDRATLWRWWQGDVLGRLKPGGRVILIMTRWHPADLAGRLLDEYGDYWHVLRLPALADRTDDPLGRKIGEPLWPALFDADALARKRLEVGEREWGAQYQQDPQPDGTAFFQVADVLVAGQPVEPPPIIDSVFAIIDTATKTGRDHDGTAVSFFGFCRFAPYPLYVLDWEILQIEGDLLEKWLPTVFERLEGFARQFHARFGSLGAYIEDKSAGMILLQQAQRRGWPAQAIESKLTSVGKDERAISISGYVRAGQIKMTRQAYDRVMTYKGQTKNHFLTQVFGFRLAAKDQQDDLLDTFCYGGALALGDSGGF